MSSHTPPKQYRRLQRGAIAWMIGNRVTPNLLMLIFIVGGLMMSSHIKREVFPPFESDTVTVKVSYPGASPEEVEQGIILAVEDAVSGMEAIDEVRATAAEGSGTVVMELRDDADLQQAYQDIEAEINRITTFPDDSEKPTVSLDVHKRQVMRIDLYGDVNYGLLRRTADTVKDRLLQFAPKTGAENWKGISQVELNSPRDYEIDIAVPQSVLRRYNLTHARIASRIKDASVELPGGKVNTGSGEILLRLKNRSSVAADFADIPIITTGGASVRLGDIAEVSESFEDATRSSTYDGHPSMQLLVYRVGSQTPITVSDDTRRAMEVIGKELPAGIRWVISDDRSNIYRDRLNLLLKNAFLGLVLVLILLSLFLEFKLAFWVTMGIPISFLGTLLFLPGFDISINMISMFAFIIALGIVVDDAIIAGENIYACRQQGMPRLQAAIVGARSVAIPITCSILTNIIAFMPMLFVPGVMGKIWKVIPIVVITTFLLSWFESLFILPAHLAHSKQGSGGAAWRRIKQVQQRVSHGLERVIDRIYLPSLRRTLSLRYLFVVGMIALLLLTTAWVKSGRVRLISMPRVESDKAVVTAVLPWGSPAHRLEAVQRELLTSLDAVVKKQGGKKLLTGTIGRINDNTVRVDALLTPAGERPISTGRLTRLWREKTGPISGLTSLTFESDRGGPGGGAALTAELTHRNINTLELAAGELAAKLANFPQVKDIDPGHAAGKMQYTYKVNQWGRDLGLTANEVGRQIRNAWQGAIALRQQRDGNEVTVRVRLPEAERSRESSIEEMRINTPGGSWVALGEITTLHKAPGYTTISRRNGRRTVTVKANVVPIGDTQIITAELTGHILPQLMKKYPGLGWGFEGRQADRRDSMGALGVGFLYALGGIYLLLAIPFRSYTQPMIVMAAIPFGIIGAIYGHMLMGYNLSIMSMMGMVALSGVVVNDSLVLVDYINRRRDEGEEVLKAVLQAGERRFRPVLLTTLTTFGGLAPMIFETSRQARFLIPMAISLGFGILFATVITLALVPSLYCILDDLHSLFAGKEEDQYPEEKVVEKLPEEEDQARRIEDVLSALPKKKHGE